MPKPLIGCGMRSAESKELRSPSEVVPERLGSGTSVRAKTDAVSLPSVMRLIASDLMQRFSTMIAADPTRFKKQVVYYLKRNLPPGPGRPAEDAITKAMELRTQGHSWQFIYQLCIANHLHLPPAERRVAQDNLRAACRSRRNAAKRRKRRRTCAN